MLFRLFPACGSGTSRSGRPKWNLTRSPSPRSRSLRPCATRDTNHVSMSEAVPTSSEAEIVIPVGGMTCAACQAHVQRALRKLPGVRKASVNLMTREAAVAFEPDKVVPDELVSAIRASGYEAELPGEIAGDALAQQEKQDEEGAAEFRN